MYDCKTNCPYPVASCPGCDVYRTGRTDAPFRLDRSSRRSPGSSDLGGKDNQSSLERDREKAREIH